MLERFAGRLVDGMLTDQTIPEEDAGLVLFGIVQGLRSVMEILIILVTGLMLNVFWQAVIIVVTFLPLRIYAGGYHAKTPAQCAIMTWLLFFCSFMWIRFMPETVWLQIFMIAIAGICIWVFSPVEHENKPLEEYEVVRYARRARFIYFAEVTLAVVLNVAKMKELSRSIVTGIVMVWGIMMAAVVQNRMPFITKIGRLSQKDLDEVKKQS